MRRVSSATGRRRARNFGPAVAGYRRSDSGYSDGDVAAGGDSATSDDNASTVSSGGSRSTPVFRQTLKEKWAKGSKRSRNRAWQRRAAAAPAPSRDMFTAVSSCDVDAVTALSQAHGASIVDGIDPVKPQVRQSHLVHLCNSGCAATATRGH